MGTEQPILWKTERNELMRSLLSVVSVLLVGSIGLAADVLSYKAGTAKHIITPTEPLWMAGYGNRDKPCNPKQPERIKAYTQKLRGWMVETIVKAYEDRKPAKLSIGKGTARFAMNRREPTPKGIINGRNPEGPVDHDVPVLRVEDAKGTLKAVV